MIYTAAQDNTASLQRLGNLAFVVMGMRTEGGRAPYLITVSANSAAGAIQDPVTGNWWQGDPISKSGYSLGVMQYDFGAFGNRANTNAFAQQIAGWAQSQGKTLDAGSASGLAAQLALRGGTTGQGLEVAGNWMSANDRDVINGYLATDAGQRWTFSNLEVGNFVRNASGDIVSGTRAVTLTPAFRRRRTDDRPGRRAMRLALTKVNRHGGHSHAALQH